MIRLIPAIIIMLYYWLFRIKSYGKLLIFSTVTALMLQTRSLAFYLTKLLPSQQCGG
jgi:hypothetical protein